MKGVQIQSSEYGLVFYTLVKHKLLNYLRQSHKRRRFDWDWTDRDVWVYISHHRSTARLSPQAKWTLSETCPQIPAKRRFHILYICREQLIHKTTKLSNNMNPNNDWRRSRNNNLPSQWLGMCQTNCVLNGAFQEIFSPKADILNRAVPSGHRRGNRHIQMGLVWRYWQLRSCQCGWNEENQTERLWETIK